LFRLKRNQKTILDHDVYLPNHKVEALEKTWAGPFRRQILPLIDEEKFRPFYCPHNGRPNVPVAIMTGLSILKEYHNLTDEQVLGSLEFDLRWQYAFDINLLESHICQKTFHNFRVLVTTNDKAKEIFTETTDKIINQAGLSTEKQRLDSTHIISNMANLSRLQLFVRTIEGFLRQLQRKHPVLSKKLPSLYDKVYLKRAGYFADVKSSRARRRLLKSAQHLFDLVDRFRGHQQISRMQSYQLMVRLLEEQCEITEGGVPKVILKNPKDISSESLQNPSDPDATYGHKGKGYKLSLTETCVKDNPFQVITDVQLDGAHGSDQKDVIPVIDRLKEMNHKPEELFADAGYGSGENILEAQQRGVQLSAPLTVGKPPDEEKMQLSDFETSSDYIQVKACIKGHAPRLCRKTKDGKMVEAIFSGEHCTQCELLPLCLVKRRKKGLYRLRYKPKDMAASQRRVEQQTTHFKERYKIRSGIEATISEADRLTGLKRVWTRGKDRVTMSVFIKALAINIKRYIQYEIEKAKEGLHDSGESLSALYLHLIRYLKVNLSRIFAPTILTIATWDPNKYCF
jgi:hypothetical protein